MSPWFGFNSETLDTFVWSVLPLAVASGPLWAPPAQCCSSHLAAPAKGWRTSWAIWRDEGMKACLQSLGARGEASFGRWWWSLRRTSCVGAGRMEAVAGVCGPAEGKELGKEWCLQTQRGHRSEPGARSQSSGPPRCTAGRAGQHLLGTGRREWKKNIWLKYGK